MKKEFLKKVMALGLAGAMMLGMTTSVFAANPVRTNNATTMEIPLTQTLYFKNADSKDVYEPNIQYAYSIAPGTGNVDITDNAGTTVKVKPGDMRAFNMADATTPKTDVFINFSSDHAVVATNAAGTTALTKKITVPFDGEKIVSDGKITPGVYRYIITQTTTVKNKNLVGITEEGTQAQDKTLVLDVTVQNDGKVAGAVIQDPNRDPENPDNPTVDNKEKGDDNGKTTGFGGGTEDPDPTEHENPKDKTEPADPDSQTTQQWEARALPAYYDMYTTYNVTISKSVTGAMGDKSNFFPFEATLSNSINNAKFTYEVTNNGSKNQTAYTTNTIKTVTNGTKYGSATATVADGFELRDQGKITLIGVPSSTTAEVSVLANEFNNTKDKYKVTAADFGITSATDLDASSASTAVTPKSFKTSTTPTFTFTNDLPAISPTGVALRFAPYLLILAGAFFLVAFTRRRRVEE